MRRGRLLTASLERYELIVGDIHLADLENVCNTASVFCRLSLCEIENDEVVLSLLGFSLVVFNLVDLGA